MGPSLQYLPMKPWSFVPAPLVPRSYLVALLAAFLFSMLPLVTALLFSVVQMHSLAQASRAAMERAADFGSQTRALRETLVALERTLRQAQVLGAKAVGSTYEVHRARVLSVTHKLANEVDAQAGLSGSTNADTSTTGETGAADSTHARANVQAALSQIDAALDGANPDVALNAFTQLDTVAEQLINAAQLRYEQTHRELSNLPAQFSTTVLWMAAAALPLALAMAFLFAWRLGQPIQRLGAAMLRLGRGDLHTEVAVRGPHAVAQLGTQLEWLRQHLARLEHAREKFLRNVSHDLKTPLAAIAEGAASLAEQLYGGLTDAQHAVVRLMAHNTTRLGARIDALLREGTQPAQASAAHPAKPGTGYVSFDLSTLTQHVLNEHRLALLRRQITVAHAFETAHVVGDADAVRIAIDNLISNAVKFSPQGGQLKVRVRVQGAQAQVVVADEGPGINLDEIERIFMSGVRGSAAAQGLVAGSGHGLAITREIAQAHGGHVWVEPTARHRGAVFVLALPQLEPPSHELAA